MEKSNKGLTLDQFKEIVEFAQNYHEFGRYYDEIERAGITLLYPKWKHLHIKRVFSVYFTDTERIFSIAFHSEGIDREFSSSHFNLPELYGITAASFFDWIMQYLKGEIE
jgi:hypothetical protein